MKINKIAVSSSNISKTIKFYSTLDLEFPECKTDEKHIESLPKLGEVSLMIDTKELLKEISGVEPKPSSHSVFAIEYDTTTEIDNVTKQLVEQDFKIIKAPWKAFWGQYYAIVEDPDGYKVDLYVNI